MTGAEFCTWLDDMREAGAIKTDKDAAALLGFHPKRISQMKRDGTSKLQTDELCHALLTGTGNTDELSTLRRLAAKHGFKLVPVDHA